MGYFNVAGATELSARYSAGPLKVLAVSSTTQQTTGINDTQRDIGASYNVSDALYVTAGVQSTNLASAATPTQARATSVGTVYTMGQNKFAATYTSLNNSTVGATATELGLGYDYLLSTTTKLYAHMSHLSDNSTSGITAYVTPANLAGTAGHSYTKSAFGVRMDF